MANETKTLEVALLDSIDQYLELFKFIKAYDSIYGKGVQYFGADKVDKGRVSVSDDELITTIIDKYNEFGYSSKPSLEEILNAIKNAQKMTGEKDWGKAVRLLADNSNVLTSSYKQFKDKNVENVKTSLKNSQDAEKTLKQNRKQNAKSKRRRFAGVLGKIATATATATLAGGGLSGVFSLAGGFAGLASISAMPFLTLSLVGGVIAYRVGKAVVGKIWKSLNKVIDKANAVIKGDVDVLGSNKSLKNAKKLAKQNAKTFNLLKSRENAYSSQNTATYNEIESLIASVSNAQPGHMVDLGVANVEELQERVVTAPVVTHEGPQIITENGAQVVPGAEIVAESGEGNEKNNNKADELVNAKKDDNGPAVEVPVTEVEIEDAEQLQILPTDSGNNMESAHSTTPEVVRENTFYGYALPKVDQDAIVRSVVEEATEELDNDELGDALVEVKKKVAQHFANNSADYEKDPQSIAKEIKVQVFKQKGNAKKPKYYVTTTPEEVEALIKNVENSKKKSGEKTLVTRGGNGEADDLTITGFDKVSTKIDVSKMAEQYTIVAKQQIDNYAKNAQQRENDVAEYSAQTSKTNAVALTQAIENALSVRLFGRVLERDANGMISLTRDNQVFASLVQEIEKYAKKYYSGAKMDYVQDGVELAVASNSGGTGFGINGKITMAEIHKAYQAILHNQEFNFVKLSNHAEVSNLQEKVQAVWRAGANLENIIAENVGLDVSSESYKETMAKISSVAEQIYTLYKDKNPKEEQIRNLYGATINGKQLDVIEITNQYKQVLTNLVTAEKIEHNRDGFGHVLIENGKTIRDHVETHDNTLRSAIDDYVESLGISNAKRAQEVEDKIYGYFVSDLYESDGSVLKENAIYTFAGQVVHAQDTSKVETIANLPTLRGITVNGVKYSLEDIKQGVNEHLIEILLEEEKNSPEFKEQLRGYNITEIENVYKRLFPNVKEKDFINNFDNFVRTSLPTILQANGVVDESAKSTIVNYLVHVSKPDEKRTLDLPEGISIKDIASYITTSIEAERKAQQDKIIAEKTAIENQIATRLDHQSKYNSLHRELVHISPSENGKGEYQKHKNLPDRGEIIYQLNELSTVESATETLDKYHIVPAMDWAEFLDNNPQVVQKLEAWFTGRIEKNKLFDNTITIDGEKLDLQELENVVLSAMQQQFEDVPRPPKFTIQSALDLAKTVFKTKDAEPVNQVTNDQLNQQVAEELAETEELGANEQTDDTKNSNSNSQRRVETVSLEEIRKEQQQIEGLPATDQKSEKTIEEIQGEVEKLKDEVERE